MKRIVPLKTPTGEYTLEPNLWYRCLRCDQTIAMWPKRSTNCKCRNIEIDVGYGRLDIREEKFVEAFVDDEMPHR